ncbi:hypothetical protein E4T52_06935 [Aureobasidium sp. EXF-3400]|nr:hypothetical protein E4T51_00148 [Aureobasidium sp. EXF-12344]KAI4778160.1 hypothetical protein E4T52_06935 [Aureobasidium sp. EXF-3400]
MSQLPECLRLLEPQLSPHGSLTWLVQEQPVIALFSKSGKPAYTDVDREFLGQTFRHTGDLGLMMSIAYNEADEADEKLLVVLSQKIVVSRRRPRIIYMFVPVESLGVELAGPSSWAMTGGIVPLHTIDDPNDARVDPSSRLLRTSFSLAAKSRVIMPNQPHLGPLSDESMSTLRKLKSLSEASCFDLFVAYSPSAQQGLLRVKVLLEENAVTGFNVNHDRFYPGGRSAVVGAWRCQGWLPQEEGVQVSSGQGVKRRHDEISGGGSSPPSYDSAAPGAAPEVTPGVASTASFDMALILFEDDAASGQESGQESVLSEVYPRGRSISPPTVVPTPKPLSPNFNFSPVAPHEAPPPSYHLPVVRTKGPTATGHRNVLVNWLATLLRRAPLMHYMCATDLLALGVAAQAGDARAIRALRAKCLAGLLRHQVVPKNTPERNEVEDLVSWLLVLDPDTGDTMFLEQLAEASQAWEYGQGVEPTPRSSFVALFSVPSSPVVQPDFVACKAGIIIDACMMYGSAWENRGVLLRAIMDLELSYR